METQQPQNTAQHDADESAPVLLFDGDCSLCNRTVRWILRHERSPVLRFASLQSDLGNDLCSRHNIDPTRTDSVVLVEHHDAYVESTAALRTCKYLRVPWRWGGVLLIVPRFIRNPAYRFIARHRYKWFGKVRACDLPKPEHRARILD